MNWQGLERRRFIRAKLPCKIIVYTPEQHTIVSETENIGAGGVRVIIEEKLDIHLIVGLEIYLNNEVVSCKGRVVWVLDTPAEASLSFDTGIEFFEIKEEDRNVIKNIVETVCYREK
ncbi:MAG: PilZ domain-containing protein [Candidatus Omnitrophota bacterium]|nr:MAG: PilZ domain-containing protein [Candidatus Omnitrophota bacterium]